MTVSLTELGVRAPEDVAALGTVLGVWAHPDDEAYLSAGLMALARDVGNRAPSLHPSHALRRAGSRTILVRRSTRSICPPAHRQARPVSTRRQASISSVCVYGGSASSRSMAASSAEVAVRIQNGDQRSPGVGFPPGETGSAGPGPDGTRQDHPARRGCRPDPEFGCAHWASRPSLSSSSSVRGTRTGSSGGPTFRRVGPGQS
jgi:hypothetical protein